MRLSRFLNLKNATEIAMVIFFVVLLALLTLQSRLIFVKEKFGWLGRRVKCFN